MTDGAAPARHDDLGLRRLWAADGGYALFVPTLTMLLWIGIVSAFLVRRYSATHTPERETVPAV